MSRHYLPFAALGLLALPGLAAAQDIGEVLEGIPDVPNAEKAEEPEAEEPAEPQLEGLPAYTKAVRRAVVDAWEVNEKVVKKNPKASAQFLIKLDADGQMVGVSAVDLSGVKKFDQSVLNAIANASFPAPPAYILTDVERGVVVRLGARTYKKKLAAQQ